MERVLQKEAARLEQLAQRGREAAAVRAQIEAAQAKLAKQQTAVKATEAELAAVKVPCMAPPCHAMVRDAAALLCTWGFETVALTMRDAIAC